MNPCQTKPNTYATVEPNLLHHPTIPHQLTIVSYLPYSPLQPSLPVFLFILKPLPLQLKNL